MEEITKKINRKQKVHQNIQVVLLLWIAATLPWSIPLNSLGIILLALNWMLSLRFLEKREILKSSFNNYALLLLFLLLTVSYFLSENKKIAGLILEQNLSFLAFPLIVGSTHTYLTRQDLHRILTVFLLSCLAAMLVCLLLAGINFFQTYDTDIFFYHKLSNLIGIHAVYFAAYISFCFFISLYFLFQKQVLLSRNLKALLFLNAIFCFLSVILLASKTILFALFLTSNLIALFYVTQYNYRKTILLILFLNAVLIITIVQIPFIQKRIQQEIKSNYEVVERKKHDHNTIYTGTTIRLIKWKLILEILDEQQAWLLGMSIGDASPSLTEKSKQINLHPGNNKGGHNLVSYNAHNQYFQYLLSLGILGLSYFIFLLLWSLYLALKHKNYLFFAFLFLFIFFSLTESTLKAQKGIVFFSFFSTLFLVKIEACTLSSSTLKKTQKPKT